MKNLSYATPGFKRKVQMLVYNREEFTVVVPADHKKWPILRPKIRHILYGEPEEDRGIMRVINTWQVLNFLGPLAGPLLRDGYDLEYDDDEDLVLVITPK